MRVPWFRKGFPIKETVIHNDQTQLDADKVKAEIEEIEEEPDTPKFFNAFEFISSMSSGFDLSSLFENKRKVGSMFTSRCTAKAIVSKIEAVAKGLSYKVCKVKDFKVKMEGKLEGRKGKLAVVAEVFEVAPEVAIVEFSKSSGDTLEYAKFCEHDVRPALKDIVWTWQGDTICDAN